VERAEKSAATVLAQQKVLTQGGAGLRTINRQSSDLLEIAETISSLKLQQNAPAAEISSSGQLVMLTQRIGKSANEFLTIEGVSPEAVFLLGKDLNTFQALAKGLLDGSAELRLGATRDTQTRERLDALLKLFEQTRKQAGAILGNLQSLVSAREAQATVLADSEPLRPPAGRPAKQAVCPDRLVRPVRRPGHWQVCSCCCAVSAFRAFSCWTAVAVRQLLKTSNATPSVRSRKPSASTTPTRPPFCG